MFRLAYRNFGDHESLVVNHTVKGDLLRACVGTKSAIRPRHLFTSGQPWLIRMWITGLGSIAMDKTATRRSGSAYQARVYSPAYTLLVVPRTLRRMRSNRYRLCYVRLHVLVLCVPGDAATSQQANLPGWSARRIIHKEGVTIFMG